MAFKKLGSDVNLGSNVNRKNAIVIPSLSSNEEIQLAVYSLDVQSGGKITYALKLQTFLGTSIAPGLVALLERLELGHDHALVDAIFEDGVQRAIYQPCLVRGTEGLSLKVCNTLLPITMGQNSFLLVGKPVLFRVGMSSGQKPYPYLTLIVKVTAADGQPYVFEFGSLFDKNTVPLMSKEDIEAQQQGFKAEFDPETNAVQMPTLEAFEAATQLLMGWGLNSAGGQITRMGQLNQLLAELDIDPTAVPLVFWPKGGKLQPPQEGKDYPPSFRFWGKWADSTLAAVPELEHITHLSLNEPSIKAPNRIHWMLMLSASNTNTLEGCALKILNLSEPLNHCSKLGFYTKAKVEKERTQFNQGIADALGFGEVEPFTTQLQLTEGKETIEALALAELPADFKDVKDAANLDEIPY